MHRHPHTSKRFHLSSPHARNGRKGKYRIEIPPAPTVWLVHIALRSTHAEALITRAGL